VSAIGVTRNEKTVSGALALGMHLLFAVLLLFGVAWQHKRSDAPVVVDLWSNLPPLPQPKVVAPPPDVKPEPEPPKPAPAPKVEPKPVPKPDIALKEKAEKDRKKKEQDEAEAKKRDEEKKKQVLRDKQEKEAKAKADKAHQDALRKLEEQAAAQRAAQANAQQRLIEDYKRRISDKIRRFVVLPPNLQGNPEAEFEVVQIPGGEVLSVKLKRSSGNSAYDAAVERAIYKAQPLPPPPETFRFGDFRELSLKFRPKE
jgi:colicin import membrane protein